MAKRVRTPKADQPQNGPVEVTVQPVTRCQECGIPVTYSREPGAASAALTLHYIKTHP